MKNHLLLLSIIGLFCSTSIIQAQSLNELQPELQSVDNSQNLGQSSSPLMMFGGDLVEAPKAPDEEKQDPRQTQDPRLVLPNRPSQATRGSLTQGITEDTEIDSPVVNQPVLTLQDFREALAANPTAARFVIVNNGDIASIQPSEVTAGNRTENLAIINALRNALEKEHSSESRSLVAQVIGQNNLLTYANSHLSGARLRQILENPNLTTGPTTSAPNSNQNETIDTYLEDEICKNIYTTCLAKVALLSQQAETWSLPEKELREQQEWVIAEKAAGLDLDRAKWNFEQAEKKAQLLPPEAPTDHPLLQAKNLAQAEVDMAAAVLYAITIHDTPSLRDRAEEQLAAAEKTKQLLQQKSENDYYQRVIEFRETSGQKALDLEKAANALLAQATSENTHLAKISQSKLTHLWDQAINQGETALLAWNQFIQQQEEKSSSLAPRHQSTWQEELQDMRLYQKELESKVTSWKKQKEDSLQARQQLIHSKNLTETEQLLQEAQKEEAEAIVAWSELKLPPQKKALNFEPPEEKAIRTAKTTLQAFDRVIASYTRLETHTEEPLLHAQERQAYWTQKIQEAPIAPPYFPDPNFEKLTKALFQKPWREEGAAFETFQNIAIERALKKEVIPPIQQEQLDQELASWNNNLAHQAANIQRWNAYKAYKKIKPQSEEAQRQLNFLKKSKKEKITRPKTLEEEQLFDDATETGSTLSTISSIEAERLKHIIGLAITAEGIWSNLAVEANAQRERLEGNSGIKIPYYSTCLDAWEKADLAIIQKEEAILEQQETAARDARMQQNWEASKRRWALQEEIEQEESVTANLQITLDHLNENLRPAQQQEREQTKKEIADKKILIAAKKQIAKDQASEDLRVLALQEQLSQLTIISPEEKEVLVSRAIKRIEKEDEMVRHTILTLPEETKEDPKNAPKTKTNKQTSSAANKAILLSSSFQAINSERLKIQAIKDAKEAQRCYDLLVPQEEEAIKRYQLLSEEQATDAAIDSLSSTVQPAQAAQAWRERADIAKTAAERKSRERQHPRNWQGSFEQSPQGLYLIAQADQAAWEAFQKEEQHLSDIKKTWERETSSQHETAFKKGQAAAEHYRQSDITPWHMLSLDERRIHNNQLIQTVHDRFNEIEHLLEQTLSDAVKAITTIKTINESYATFYYQATKQKALDRTESAEKELKHIIHLFSDPLHHATLTTALTEQIHAAAERDEEAGMTLALSTAIIHWLPEELRPKLPLTPEEVPLLSLTSVEKIIRCCATLQAEVSRQMGIMNKSNIAPLETEAKANATTARATSAQANKTQGPAKYPLYDQAIEQAERTLLLYEHIVAAREEELKTIRSSKKESALYDLEEARTNQLFGETQVAYYRAYKLRWIALDAKEKAKATEGDQVASAWEEAIAALHHVQPAVEKFVASCRKRVVTTSARFQNEARSNLEKALSSQTNWKNGTTLGLALKAEAIAHATWERQSFFPHAISHGTSHVPEHLTMLTHQVKEAALANEKCATQNRNQLENAEERFKIDWKRNLVRAKHKQLFWSLWGKVLEKSQLPPSHQGSSELVQEHEAAWHNLLQAAEVCLQEMTDLLEEGLEKGNFNYINGLEILHYEKALALHSASWCQAIKDAEMAHVAYTAYQEWRENINTAAARDWNEVRQSLKHTMASWQATIALSKHCLSEAPEDWQPSWCKLVREAKTQYYLWEGRELWWEAEKKELENAPPQEIITAWDRVIEDQSKKAHHAPDHLKLLWMKNRDLAIEKKQQWESLLAP